MTAVAQTANTMKSQTKVTPQKRDPGTPAISCSSLDLLTRSWIGNSTNEADRKASAVGTKTAHRMRDACSYCEQVVRHQTIRSASWEKNTLKAISCGMESKRFRQYCIETMAFLMPQGCNRRLPFHFAKQELGVMYRTICQRQMASVCEKQSLVRSNMLTFTELLNNIF